MRHISLFLFFALAAAASVLTACDAFIPDAAPGELVLRFAPQSFGTTRAAEELPDTNDFVLTVLDSKGNEIYNGKYGSSPESIVADPGSYTVSVVSSDFQTPKFSSPQYGDKQVVVISSGTRAVVEFVCRQMNSGVKLKIASSFLTSYPKGSLHLKNDDGKLLYSYSEKRIAYFRPGPVSLVMSNGGTDNVLLTRTLESQEILVLNVSAPGSVSSSSQSGAGSSIRIDTTRYWSSEEYVIGQGGSSGDSRDKAYNVSAAKSHAGEEDVWVYGYVVGGDLSSSGASFSTPFKSRTNLAIASRASTSDKASCMSVQLQKGDIRDDLNLVDNPDILGCEVFLKGDIVEAYYGIPGIQNITEYELK